MREYLYGTTLGGTITPVNSANMIDLAFNDAYASFLGATGTVDYTAFQSIQESLIGNVKQLTLQLKFYASSNFVNDSMLLQLWNGSTWQTLDTFNSGNNISTTPIIREYNILPYLNTISKIQNTQLRFNYTVSGGADLTVYVDEARLVTNSVSPLETLYGNAYTSTGYSLTNIINSIDREFNNLVALLVPLGTNQNIVFDIEDTYEADMASISNVYADVRFRGTAPVNDDTITIDIYDGTWVNLATYNAGNPWQTSLGTISFDVTSIINSIAKINGCQIRISYTKSAGLDSNVEVDEVRLRVQKRAIQAYETIAIQEALTARKILRVSVFDAVTITENVSVYLDRLNTSVFDSINITEWVYVYLDVLNVSVLDPFHVLITEVAQVLDLVIEVGVVTEITEVSDAISFYLDVLNLSIYDDITVDEFTKLYPTELYLSAYDNVAIEEFAYLYLDYLFLSVYEEIIINEFVYLYLTELFLDIYDEISHSEYLSIYLDVLNVDVLDPFHCVVTEHTDVIDLVVEVGIVEESIYVLEYAKTYLDVLNIDFYDAVTVQEYYESYLNYLFINVNEEVSISEFATVLDIIIELGIAYEEASISEDLSLNLDVLNIAISDTATIEEVASMSLTELFLSVSEDISTAEYANILDIVIELEAYEEISILDYAIMTDIIIELGVVYDEVFVAEYSIIALDNLLISVEESLSVEEYAEISLDTLNINVVEEYIISITEYANIFDIVIELFAFDGVSVADVMITESGVEIGDDVTVSYGAKFENIPIAESVALYIPIALSVYDDIAIEEYANVFDIIIELGIVFEDLAIAEDLAIYLPIEVDVYEDLLLTEYANILDIVVELYAEENIAVTEEVSFYVETQLSVYEDIAIVEYANILDIVIELYAQEDIAVSEFEYTLLPYLLIDQFESISLTEFEYTLLPILLISLYEDISLIEYSEVLDIIIELGIYDEVAISEFNYVYLNVLNVTVIDPFHCLITEHIDVLDIIVELGVVTELITVTEDRSLYLDVLNLSVSDNILVSESIYLVLPILFIPLLSEDLFINEVALIVDLVIELGIVADATSIEEWVFALIPEYFTFVEENIITLDESIDVSLLSLIFEFDDILVEEQNELYIQINIALGEDIAIEEVITPLVLYWDLYPRIYRVNPRHRIFVRDETIYDSKEAFI